MSSVPPPGAPGSSSPPTSRHGVESSGGSRPNDISAMGEPQNNREIEGAHAIDRSAAGKFINGLLSGLKGGGLLLGGVLAIPLAIAATPLAAIAGTQLRSPNAKYDATNKEVPASRLAVDLLTQEAGVGKYKKTSDDKSVLGRALIYSAVPGALVGLMFKKSIDSFKEIGK